MIKLAYQFTLSNFLEKKLQTIHKLDIKTLTVLKTTQEVTKRLISLKTKHTVANIS
jgi:hypothetical protein